MKFIRLFGTGILGIACCATAAAQAPLQKNTGVPAPSTIPRLPPASIPGQPGGTPEAVAGPGGTSQSSLPSQYPNGVPLRDLDAGPKRAAQPRSGQAMPGAQPTKSIFKGRKRRDN